jgi:hypothetical protein
VRFLVRVLARLTGHFDTHGCTGRRLKLLKRAILLSAVGRRRAYAVSICKTA